MPQTTDEIKISCSQNGYNFTQKKKKLLRRGYVFDILFNIHEQMSTTIHGLGLVHNRDRLLVTKGCIISKQILRALRGDSLSSSLSLCVNIKLGKIKI